MVSVLLGLRTRAGERRSLGFLSVVGEGRSLAEERERLPLLLSGVRAERLVKVLMLAVRTVPVCTGVCASVRVTAARVMRSALVGDEGGSVVSVAEGRTRRASALDRSTRRDSSRGSSS